MPVGQLGYAITLIPGSVKPTLRGIQIIRSSGKLCYIFVGISHNGNSLILSCNGIVI